MPKGQGKATVEDVMGKFKRGTLKSGSGGKVQKRDQAVAIAMKESGMSKPQRKAAKKGAKNPLKGRVKNASSNFVMT